jgi:hypothetical protein
MIPIFGVKDGEDVYLMTFPPSGGANFEVEFDLDNKSDDFQLGFYVRMASSCDVIYENRGTFHRSGIPIFVGKINYEIDDDQTMKFEENQLVFDLENFGMIKVTNPQEFLKGYYSISFPLRISPRITVTSDFEGDLTLFKVKRKFVNRGVNDNEKYPGYIKTMENRESLMDRISFQIPQQNPISFQTL